jgi:hypothetical protein
MWGFTAFNQILIKCTQGVKWLSKQKENLQLSHMIDFAPEKGKPICQISSDDDAIFFSY